MKAVQFKEHGGYDRLHIVELPKPESQNGEVIVRITAASTAPADDTIRAGKMPFAQMLPHIPGNAGAGVIDEPGESGLPKGTPVLLTGMYGFRDDGTWREYMAVPPHEVTPFPAALTDIEAASLLEPYTSAYAGLIQGGFQAGQRVLIPAVGGGLGNAGVQLARALGAAQVITTAGSTRKSEQARELGYQNVIDLSQERLSEGVARLTSGQGVPLAIDSVGGAITGEALASLSQRGTLVALGYRAGTQVTLDWTDMMWKSAKIISASPSLFTPEEFRTAIQLILDLAAAGKIKPLVDRTFPLEQAAEAQRYLIEDRPFGKVILTLH